MVNFKEAAYYKKLPEKRVRCMLCPHDCIIGNGEVGKCNVRMNIHGKLKAMNYGKPHTVSYENIGELPLYHFLPKTRVLTVGAVGDNLDYQWNRHEFHGKSFDEVPTINQDSVSIVKQAQNHKVKVIAYKHSEPGMFFEFVRDISNNSRRLKHVLVTNGYLESGPAKELCKRVDAALFDIHSMNESFYDNILKGKLDPILNTMKIFHNSDVWMEIKMTIVPRIHEDLYDVRKLVSWILNNLDANVPLHFISKEGESNFELLSRIKKIAKSAGLNYVYVHGVDDREGQMTFCPNCEKPVLYYGKKGFNFLNKGKCACGKEIAGIWQ